MTTLIPKYEATGATTVNRPIKEKLAEILSVKDWGAVGDGITDDTAAFTALSTYINDNYIVNTQEPIGIYFPQGKYKYSDGLDFQAPVCLYSEDLATLSYTGNSHAIRLGATSISGFETYTQGEYTVQGLRITSTNTAVHGIYIRDKVISPRIRNCIFVDFGSGAGGSNYCIFGQSNNWDSLVEDCSMITLNRSDANANFIAFTGKDTLGVSDGGNSRVSVINCFMAAYNNIDLGVFALINAAKSRIIGGSFVNSSYGILLGPLANGVLIDGVYCEMANNAISYITVSSETVGGAVYYPQDVMVCNGYINFHNLDNGATGKLLKPFNADVRIRNWTIKDILYGNTSAGYELIELNDAAGQPFNVATNITKAYIPASSDDGYKSIIIPDYTYAENWSDPGNVVSVLEVPNNTYTLQASDAGQVKRLTGGSTVVTIPLSQSSPYIRIGAVIYLHNETGGNQTVVPTSGVALSLAGASGSGTRTIAANGLCKLTCLQKNIWIAEGNGVT